MLTPEEDFFFSGKPAEEKLYDALVKQMRATLPPFELRVQKTQITFIHPLVFACVSLKWKDCIVVSFGLPDRVLSPRIYQASEIRAGRWTMHVKIRQCDEIDHELLGWLNAAYAFSARNQTPE